MLNYANFYIHAKQLWSTNHIDKIGPIIHFFQESTQEDYYDHSDRINISRKLEEDSYYDDESILSDYPDYARGRVLFDYEFESEEGSDDVRVRNGFFRSISEQKS